MTMNRSALAKVLGSVLGLGAIALQCAPAQAAPTSPPPTTGCGISGSATASPANYDPFNPTGLQVTNVSLTLSRINGSGGQKTDIVNFYLGDLTGRSNGVQVIPRTTAVAGQVLGLGYDIFYDTTETKPIVSPTSLDPSPGNRFLKIIFTGNNQNSDTAVVNFDVIVPAETSLQANNNDLFFTAFFGCSTTGGGAPTQQTGQLSDTVRFPIHVMSALRATYTGAALDFGEIGNIDNAGAPGKNTGSNNYIRVESTGPYRVTWSSANAYRLLNQNYTLATATGTELVKYNLGFMGETRSNTNSATGTVVCPSAGLKTAFEDKLYMRATLAEGGAGKTPSLNRNYSDELTVTIEPLVYNAPAGSDCSAIPLP